MKSLKECKSCDDGENCFYRKSLPIEVEIYGCGIDDKGKKCVLLPRRKGVD
jgi:hypothetical protein